MMAGGIQQQRAKSEDGEDGTEGRAWKYCIACIASISARPFLYSTSTSQSNSFQEGRERSRVMTLYVPLDRLTLFRTDEVVTARGRFAGFVNKPEAAANEDAALSVTG
jgi:hypothetical protein